MICRLLPDNKKQEYNEITEVEYPSYDSAEAHRNEWEEFWQDYLDDQGK